VNRRLSRMLAAGLVASLFGLIGCGSDEPYLAALQSDPMATWQPADAELTHESTQEYDAGGSASKQRLAQVRRIFALPSAQEVLVAQQRALKQARGDGWDRDELDRDGFLQRSGPRGSTLTLSALPSATDDQELVVTLSAP
jgi:hypothetical protein